MRNAGALGAQWAPVQRRPERSVDRWTDVGNLAGIEVMIIAVIFAVVWLLDAVQTVSGGRVSFLHV